jgi:hypothetical protein
MAERNFQGHRDRANGWASNAHSCRRRTVSPWNTEAPQAQLPSVKTRWTGAILWDLPMITNNLNVVTRSRGVEIAIAGGALRKLDRDVVLEASDGSTLARREPCEGPYRRAGRQKIEFEAPFAVSERGQRKVQTSRHRIDASARRTRREAQPCRTKNQASHIGIHDHRPAGVACLLLFYYRVGERHKSRLRQLNAAGLCNLQIDHESRR